MSIIDRDHARSRLEPAIAGLKSLTAESLRYDSELLEQCLGLALWLQHVLDGVNGIEIEEPDGDIETRSLIASVTLRRCSLFAEIEQEQKLGQAAIDDYEERLADAKFAGCRVEDLPQYPHVEVAAYQANISDLETELQKLEAFLASDSHDLALLNGTSFQKIQE